MTASAALLAGLGTSANALPFNLQPQAAPQPGYARPAPTMQRPAKPVAVNSASRDKSTPKESADELAPKANGILGVIISIERQQLTLYSDGRPLRTSRVSTGTASLPTPTGAFSVIQKDRWHRSNIYNNAPMFFMQRITWSGVAMHQGVVPNHPASHGCIRLPEAFARQLWGVTQARHPRHRRARRGRPGGHRPCAPVHAPARAARSQAGGRRVVGRARQGRLWGVRRRQLGSDKRKANGDGRGRPGNPAFDAMAYARTPRGPPATSSEVVKSTYDGFETPRSAA